MEMNKSNAADHVTVVSPVTYCTTLTRAVVLGFSFENSGVLTACQRTKYSLHGYSAVMPKRFYCLLFFDPWRRRVQRAVGLEPASIEPWTMFSVSQDSGLQE
jgi:hypothetical protein